MSYFHRLLQDKLMPRFYSGKALIIVGARQTGKTSMIKRIFTDEGLSEQVQSFNGDNLSDRQFLNDASLEHLQDALAKKPIIFIDEGQKVARIGEIVKLLVDHYGEEKQVVVTGSSSIHLLTQTQEALTGRKYVYHLFPLSLEELAMQQGKHETLKQLNSYITYGTYPEVVTKSGREDKIEMLYELNSSYLYRDILEFQNIRQPDILVKLLKALALQIGSEVSSHELGNLLGIDKNTVDRYIDLLEKSFVIFRLSPYYTNKRKEISKMKKVFFFDTGIRNAILNDFTTFEDRHDRGALWENFIIVERMKYRSYHRIFTNQYFYRTYSQSEIDLVEDREGKLFGFEIKWQSKGSKKAPQPWSAYPNSSYEVIDRNALNNFVW